MARGGFTAIDAGTIRFGRDGRWYCDDEPITNAAICRLYARAMTVDADGSARLELGDDRAAVVVDDTPWVVRRVDGDSTSGYRVTLNDGTSEALDLASLRVGPRNVVYCRVKGAHEARLLRPAYYQLMAHAEPVEGGGCRLRARGVEARLAPRE